VIIVCADGSEDVRSGGTRSWRNNNPGNIGAGRFSRSQGSIGAAGGANNNRFAVFADYGAGRQAQLNLLRRSDYQGMGVDAAIARWAPPEDGNPTAAYQAYVRNALGVTGDVKLSDLTEAQLNGLADALQRFEGWREGTVVNRRPQQQ
jgi:hypothetical protein